MERLGRLVAETITERVEEAVSEGNLTDLEALGLAREALGRARSALNELIPPSPWFASLHGTVVARPGKARAV